MSGCEKQDTRRGPVSCYFPQRQTAPDVDSADKINNLSRAAPLFFPVACWWRSLERRIQVTSYRLEVGPVVLQPFFSEAGTGRTRCCTSEVSKGNKCVHVRQMSNLRTADEHEKILEDPGCLGLLHKSGGDWHDLTGACGTTQHVDFPFQKRTTTLRRSHASGVECAVLDMWEPPHHAVEWNTWPNMLVYVWAPRKKFGEPPLFGRLLAIPHC